MSVFHCLLAYSLLGVNVDAHLSGSVVRIEEAATSEERDAATFAAFESQDLSSEIEEGKPAQTGKYRKAYTGSYTHQPDARFEKIHMEKLKRQGLLPKVPEPEELKPLEPLQQSEKAACSTKACTKCVGTVVEQKFHSKKFCYSKMRGCKCMDMGMMERFGGCGIGYTKFEHRELTIGQNISDDYGTVHYDCGEIDAGLV